MFIVIPKKSISTSDKELLSVNPGVAFGFLQQADPVVHLLRCVCVAVDHPVCRDDHKWVGPAKGQRKSTVMILKGSYQCCCVSLLFVNIGHIGYINLTRFSQKSFIYEIQCLFTFCLYLINITESSWKCMTTLAKRKSVSKSFFRLMFELGRQHLWGTIFPGVITLVSMASLSLSLAQWFFTK